MVAYALDPFQAELPYIRVVPDLPDLSKLRLE